MENLKSKILYKIEVEFIRIIPALLVVIHTLNSILSYFGIDIPLLSYLGGISIFPLLFLYLTSYVFKFCFFHRLCLHYVTITWLLNIYDCYIGFNISDLAYLCLQMSILGILTLIVVLIYVFKNTKRITIKDSE